MRIKVLVSHIFLAILFFWNWSKSRDKFLILNNYKIVCPVYAQPISFYQDVIGTAIEHDSGEKKTTHANNALNHCAQLSYFTNRGQQLESFWSKPSCFRGEVLNLNFISNGIKIMMTLATHITTLQHKILRKYV